MNIETIFHDYKELNTLAKESSEHPHIYQLRGDLNYEIDGNRH